MSVARTSCEQRNLSWDVRGVPSIFVFLPRMPPLIGEILPWMLDEGIICTKFAIESIAFPEFGAILS